MKAQIFKIDHDRDQKNLKLSRAWPPSAAKKSINLFELNNARIFLSKKGCYIFKKLSETPMNVRYLVNDFDSYVNLEIFLCKVG